MNLSLTLLHFHVQLRYESVYFLLSILLCLDVIFYNPVILFSFLFIYLFYARTTVFPPSPFPSPSSLHPFSLPPPLFLSFYSKTDRIFMLLTMSVIASCNSTKHITFY